MALASWANTSVVCDFDVDWKQIGLNETTTITAFAPAIQQTFTNFLFLGKSSPQTTTLPLKAMSAARDITSYHPSTAAGTAGTTTSGWSSSVMSGSIGGVTVEEMQTMMDERITTMMGWCTTHFDGMSKQLGKHLHKIVTKSLMHQVNEKLLHRVQIIAKLVFLGNIQRN